MTQGLSLGRIAGIPIRIKLSFFLLLGLVFLTMGGLHGVFAILVTFASVVLHELGHALVARRLHVRIAGIDLHFFGGAALMVDPPRSARDEIAISAAGPLVSLVLAALGFLVGWDLFGWINLVLGLFNLIPALPMDGGRILRAALATRMGFFPATELAVKVSRVFAVAFGALGVVLGQFQLVLLAVFVWMLGTTERRNAWATVYRGERPAPRPVMYYVRW